MEMRGERASEVNAARHVTRVSRYSQHETRPTFEMSRKESASSMSTSFLLPTKHKSSVLLLLTRLKGTFRTQIAANSLPSPFRVSMNLT